MTFLEAYRHICRPFLWRSAPHSEGSSDGGILGGTLLPFSSYVLTPADRGLPLIIALAVQL